MSELDVGVISQELAEELRRVYGPRLRELVLYGSWARGEATSESDIDFLVILDEYDDFSEELRRLVKVSSALTLKYNVYVSTQPIRIEEYQQGRDSFLLDIRKEGRRVA
jgi:predicted nucleotidyltransferase